MWLIVGYYKRLCKFKEKADAERKENRKKYLDNVMGSVRECHFVLEPVGDLHGGEGHEDQHDNGEDQG